MDFCLNPELLLAFVLTHLSSAQLSSEFVFEFVFESDAQLRAGLLFSSFFCELLFGQQGIILDYIRKLPLW